MVIMLISNKSVEEEDQKRDFSSVLAHLRLNESDRLRMHNAWTRWKENPYNGAAITTTCTITKVQVVLYLCICLWDALFQLCYWFLRSWSVMLWHWLVLRVYSTYVFIHSLYVNNVVNIFKAKALNAADLSILWTATWQCFLFDIQQVTVSTADSSVLHRVHGGEVSLDDATHGALLKLLLLYLGSILVGSYLHAKTPTKTSADISSISPPPSLFVSMSLLFYLWACETDHKFIATPKQTHMQG